MDKVFRIVDDIYDIYQNAKKNKSINPPSWKEKYGAYYKYYFNNKVEVDFSLKEKKLIINYKDLDLSDEYIIAYPRFTTKGKPDDENFFNFYFIVEYKNKLGVIIVRGVNITNLKDLYDSPYNIEIESRQAYISEEEVVMWQEYIYRGLGLGSAVEKLELKDNELENMQLTRGEAAYVINEIYLQAIRVYLDYRFQILGLDPGKQASLYQDAYSLEEAQALGLEPGDYQALGQLKEEISLNQERKLRLEEGRSKHQVSLPELMEKVTRDILKQQKPIFINKANVIQTLRQHHMDIGSIDLAKLASKLVYRVVKTKLTVAEILDMVINYERGLDEALHVVEVRKNLKKEKDLAAL